MLAKRAKLFFTLSLGILVLAIVLAVWGIPGVLKQKIASSVRIENNSLMYSKWVKTPFPLDFKVYLFNVTNVEDVNAGAKPELQELGPYVYKQYREKSILSLGENDTIKYMLKKKFTFDAEASGSFSDEDEVTVINFPYLAAITTVQDMMPGFVPMINDALAYFIPGLKDPFMRTKVKDLLFEGIFLDCSGNHSALGLICSQIKADKPPTMRPTEDGKGFMFSFFSHMNLTETGPYDIIRGTKNIQDLGHIVGYKGETSIKKWGDKYCGQMNGTDSTIFPPYDDSTVPERLYTFEPDICRSLYANFVDKREVNNITAYYFEISRLALASKSAEPNNKCFCKKNWSSNHDGCLLMGVINLQPCQGATAIASLPHFYLASEELVEYFASGINPDKEKHNTYIYLDSISGVAIKGAKRLQFNIELRNIKEVPQLANVQTGLFPLLWMEEGADLPESELAQLRSSHRLISIAYGARWTILVAAIVLTLVAAATVARATSMKLWSSNSVSFILQPGNSANANKGN